MHYRQVLTTAVTSPGWSLAFSTRALPKATKGAAHRRPTVQELSRVASRLGLYQRTDCAWPHRFGMRVRSLFDAPFVFQMARR